MSRTRYLKCPQCGREDGTHYSVICGSCDVNMVETLPAENSAVDKKRSAEIIFKGPGWTPKGDEK